MRKILNNVNKISAVYLWWFLIVFVLIVFDSYTPFLPQGINSTLARYPYSWDYELMFVVLYSVWGVFLWKNKDLNRFSGFAFVAQGLTMIILGTIRKNEFIHLFSDSVLWIVLGFLLLKEGK